MQLRICICNKFQVMLMVTVEGPHLEKHCSRQKGACRKRHNVCV